MASTNGITGDSLVNKPNSKEYEENYDKIFGKKKSRMDVIGQNGNSGDHYEYELNKSTGEVEKRFKEGFEKPNGDQFGD
ncbi:hypothetical protein EB001_07010 [bacterium]|jgi:hypothetical protein|nr:hypothetical protein [bacterium]